MVRHLLRDDDLSPAEQSAVLDLAATMKTAPFAAQPLAGRTVAVLFDKPSLRTRFSFGAGIVELGGFPLVVDDVGRQFGRGEPIADVARILDRQCAAIVWRTFEQSRLADMAAHAAVPVVNALTDDFHPCQILADLLTVRERLGGTTGRIFAYVGDGANNMAHSYLLGGALAGMHVRIGSPAGVTPDSAVFERAAAIAAERGGSVSITADPHTAVAGAHVVATDTWVSMGDSDLDGSKAAALVPFAVTAQLMRSAEPDALVLHCLPAYRGKEIEAEFIDGADSAVWDEAENRRHVQKAVLAFLLDPSVTPKSVRMGFR
jgi:ornithine carbamoyltransferase